MFYNEKANMAAPMKVNFLLIDGKWSFSQHVFVQFKPDLHVRIPYDISFPYI